HGARQERERAEEYEASRPRMALRAIGASGIWLTLSKEKHGEERQRVAGDEKERGDRDHRLEGARREKRQRNRARSDQRRDRRTTGVDTRHERKAESVAAHGIEHA